MILTPAYEGLCFPNLVRQEFTLCDQDVIVTRNVAPTSEPLFVSRRATNRSPYVSSRSGSRLR